MLEQAFGQRKKLQKNLVPLFNIFSNRFDDFVHSSDNKNVISCLKKKTASRQLSVIRRNKIASNFEIEKVAAKKNKVASYFMIEKKIESANSDLSNVNFRSKNNKL